MTNGHLQNINITQKQLCFIHITFFAIQQLLIIFLIRTKIIKSIFESEIDKYLVRYFWHLEILKYIRLYINLKAVLTFNIHGYIISICMISYNFLLFTIFYITRIYYSRQGFYMYHELGLVLVTILEIIVAIAYLSFNRSKLIIQKFKKSGHNPSLIVAYNCKQIMEYLLMVDFSISSAHFINNLAHNTIISSPSGTIEFINATIIQTIFQISFRFNDDKLKVYLYRVIKGVWCYSVIALIFTACTYNKYIIAFDFIQRLLDDLLTLIIHSVLLYTIRAYTELSISLKEEDKVMKNSIIRL
jgi:hypothetical protein